MVTYDSAQGTRAVESAVAAALLIAGLSLLSALLRPSPTQIAAPPIALRQSSLGELRAMDGVGRDLAQNLRAAHSLGLSGAPADLLALPGFGPGRLHTLRRWLESTPPEASPQPAEAPLNGVSEGR